MDEKKENVIQNSIQETKETEIDELKERKEKIKKFLKKKENWIYYVILGFIVYISVYIRTRNIPRLKDITTGVWTLGPDLDPFLFLRWAEYIVEHGKLMAHDTMRYVPLGYDTSGEMKLLAYMIDWFYHFLSFFYKETTITYAAILFPVFMAALTAIAFFLFARKIFYKESEKTKNIIALLATLIFILVPSMLPRTIAGIPEKESAAFFFMFMAFYLFLEAFTSEKLKKGLIFGILSGIATAGMALIWGGVIFIFFTIPVAVLLVFVFGKIDKNNFFIYSSWLISSFALMMPFSTRYTLKNLVMSTSTGLAVGVLALIGISLLIIKTDKLKNLRIKTKLPKEIFYLIISLIILFVIILTFIGPSFLVEQILEIKSSLIVPITDRFSMTVAENRQPYFASEWKREFGPIYFNIPLFFWLFFIGSIVLFSHLIKNLNKKERMILTFSYFIFLFCLIFSRYSSSSILNGTNLQSLIIYFGGWLFFIGCFGYFYYNIYNKGEFHLFKEFNFSYILYFIILTLGIIGARGGIRLIMVLGAVSPVAISFIIIKTSQKYIKEKEDSNKFFNGIITFLVIIALILMLIGNPLLILKGTSFWSWGGYYQQDKITGENFAPGSYQWQWQKAMAWVRENTSENAVFAHWWDYGYWLQSIGKRATILDGGNTIAYWNHLMGRYVLTGDDEKKALEFLYTHDGTHLLIDSTEIGKYTAYSSIGSDENYDRFSWISTFLMDEKKTQEINNEIIYFYMGGFLLDEDVLWKENNTEIFLPKKAAGIGAIVIKKDKNGSISQPEAIFVYNGKQPRIPLRYVYFDNKLYDFKSGLDAGVFIFPKIDTSQDGKLNINNIGALMYLSKRTVHSQLANLYLFDKKSDYFKLAHTESNLFIENLRQQKLDIGEFVYYQGLQGPIKIWEINYPENIKANPEYLQTEYPKNIRMAKPGEYN